MEWMLKRSHNGYGRVKIQRHQMPAHHVAWIQAFGPIPEGLHILHKCDNPPCCDSDHLFAGTLSDNMQDMVKKGRQHRAEDMKTDPVKRMRLCQYMLQNPHKRASGERSGMAKLRMCEAEEIRRLYGLGISGPKLEKMFGITNSAIYRIIHNQGYRPVVSES